MSWSSLKKKALWVISPCIASIILLAFLFAPAYSSWKRVAQFNTTVNASFFFNEFRGFIAMDGFEGIKRTSDGGKTWKDCITPSPFVYFGYITDIFMKDSLNGWAGIENDNLSHGLWYTNDGGVTWREVMNVFGQVSSVYQTPSAIVMGDRFSLNRLSSSVNGGLNFLRSSVDRFNGINFVDDIHGVASPFASPSGTAVYTSDGGISWQKSNNAPMTTESWGVYAQKGTPNFIVAGEKNSFDPSPTESAYASYDYGASWQTVGTLFGRTTGHIAGVGPVIYTQSWTRWQYPNQLGFVGMNRSTDGGKTWKNVGGPSNYRDTRFSVTGCLGGVVYAFDESGGVWKTTDGGDGEIHEPPHNPNVVPDHIDLSSSLCATSLANLNYYNLSCNPLVVQKIEFIDSTDPAVASGALSFTRYPKLPQTLNPTDADFITLFWNPKKMGIQKLLSTTFVRIRSTMLDSTIRLDTLLAINSQSFANQPVFSLNITKVNFDSMNICQRYLDTTVSFSNGSCDTLWLDSAQLGGSVDWKMLDRSTLTSLALPLGLAPGESASFLIRFAPKDIGAQAAKLRLHFYHQGLTRDTILSFSGLCYRTFMVYGDKSVNIAPTSICTTIDTVIYLHNLNCDTLTVDGFTNNNASDFSNINGVTFPYQLPPDSAFALHFRFHALKNTTSQGLVIFQFHLAGDTSIWESSLRGNGLPGTSDFVTSMTAAQLNFTDRVACSPPDSLEFTITNPGCDSMTVLNSTIAGIGLPAISYRTEPPLPSILVNVGDKVRVVVYLQADKPTLNDGSLKLRYELSDGSFHDSSFTIHAAVSRGERKAVLSLKNIDLGIGSLCIPRDTEITITNPGCPSMTVQSVTLTGNYYAPVNPRPTPYVLATGESETFKLTYVPTGSGTDLGQVEVTTDADINPIHIIPLTASTRQIDHVNFRLAQLNSNIRSGDTAIFGFIPDRDWTGKGLQSIGFAINTNGDLLTYNGHTEQAYNTFKASVTSVSLPGRQSQLNVLLTSPTEVTLVKDQPLVKFYYATALADTISTPVTLGLLELNNANVPYANCVLSTSHQDGDFVLQMECGAKTLIDMLNGKLPILAGVTRPNPVTAQTNYQATLAFTALHTGIAQIDYYDALGKCIVTETIHIDKPGMYSAHFDGTKLCGGNYEYILKFKDGLSNSSRGHIILVK